MVKYSKSIDELEHKAVKWWPDSLKKKASNLSVIPLLLDSQEDFIAILRLCDKSPWQVFELIKAAEFPANLFLKHLTVLADYGGETTQRLNKNFSNVFNEQENGKHYFDAVFNNQHFRYKFEALPVKGILNNKKLSIDGDSISIPTKMNGVTKDMIMILLFGATAINAAGADLEKCEIGNLLGKGDDLEKYIRQKYIWVSRITGGATSNTQGQLAQNVIFDFLSEHLDKDFTIMRNGTIKLDGYSKDTGMPFDVVVERCNKFVGIEISFQVTTNSVIERKAGQAQERQNIMHNMGYNIAYVIDGAGNFQRRSAVSTICNFSDCTVAYSESEFVILAEFIKECLQ
ncbi:MAG: restriction endonuclease [Symploca sp. SIO1C2]|nr:restriction endonuclease [Symploca sp. SIO1C2]